MGGFQSRGETPRASAADWVVAGNYRPYFGGGLLVTCAATFEGLVLDGNAADWYGGGLASSVGGDVVLRRAVVSGNVLYDAEPLGDLMMGGAGVAAAVGPLVIEDSLFVGNSAGDGGGGGVAARQGGLICANCTFAGNDAADGGAALLEGATTHVFEGAAFFANVARANGGALALGAGGPEVHVRGRAAFERNVAGGDGGAVDRKSVV